MGNVWDGAHVIFREAASDELGSCKIQIIFKHLSSVHPVLVYILVYTVYILPILCNSSFFLLLSNITAGGF